MSPGIITRPLVSMTSASGGIATSAAGPTCTILLPSITTAAWCNGGTSYPSSSMPPTSASFFLDSAQSTEQQASNRSVRTSRYRMG